MGVTMLTDRGFKALTGRSRPYRKSDGLGLYIEVRPNGAKWWRFKYRFGGKEQMLSMGTYPGTSLKAARKKRDVARTELDAGINPSETRKAEKQARQAAKRTRERSSIPADQMPGSFRQVAGEWISQNPDLKPTTVHQLERRLEKYVYPHLGGRQMAEVTAPEILLMLRKIEGKGIHETAHRVRSLVSRIFRYAVATGSASRDPAADQVDALAKVKSTNFAAITAPKRIGELLRAIDGYQGQPSVMYALRLAPFVFVRPGELRSARWSDFDFARAEWRISAVRMKMDNEHVVPLARQVIELLDELRVITGGGKLLFPSLRSTDRPISNNTLNAAMRRMGFAADEMTAHGFRTMASTRLNELGYDPDAIELQLAHTDKNKVRAAYNRAQKLKERRSMMQAWADYLDGLKKDLSGVVRAIGE